MPVIAIVKQKGGVGKTILATNLAVALAQTHTVMLLNADAQGSSQDWAESRGQRHLYLEVQHAGDAGSPLQGARRLAADYNWVIVDGPAGTSRISAKAVRAVQHLPRAGQQIWVVGGVEDVGGGHLVLLVQTVGGWPLPIIILRAAVSCLYRDNVQVLYPLEMSAVVGEQGQVMAQGSRAYQKVEIADDVSGGPQAPPFYCESAADTVIQ